MKIVTDYVGEVEFTEDELINFPDGLFGFEDQKKFIIVGEMAKEFPFVWLQSTEDAHVVFVLTDPFLFVENYDFKLGDEEVKTLGTEDIKEISVYTTVVIPVESQKTSINLKSPIIVNAKKRVGLQAILDEDFPYKYSLFGKE